MALPRIVADGGLTADPELRFTPSGKAVANFTIACKDRIPDGQGGYKDSEATFLRCSLWGKPAEHLAESCRKGDIVMVMGRLQQRTFEGRDGEKRTSMEVSCDVAGPALTFTTAPTERARDGGSVSRSSGQQDDDPWATPDEPPF